MIRNLQRSIRRGILKQAAKLSSPSQESVDAIHAGIHDCTGLVPRPGEGVNELVARACGFTVEQLKEIRALVKAGESTKDAQRRVIGCEVLPNLSYQDVMNSVGAALMRARKEKAR